MSSDPKEDKSCEGSTDMSGSGNTNDSENNTCSDAPVEPSASTVVSKSDLPLPGPSNEGGNASGTSTNVSTTLDMGIKRINSTKRNYRNNQVVVESSDDSNQGQANDVPQLAGSERTLPSASSANEEFNSLFRQFLELPEQPAVNDDRGSDRNEQGGNDNNTDDGEHDEDVEVRYVAEESDTPASTPASSLHLMDDDDNEQASSSESSDCLLEDLDDEPALKFNLGSVSNPESHQSSPKKKQAESKSNQELPQVLKKPKPKHSWNGPRELLNRELGYRGKMQPQTAEVFRSQFYGSLFSAERLELMKKLDGHNGCVNCLNFNYAGTKLASGSDDLTIKIWNYGLGKMLTSFQSGHRANVFQAKFLPLIGLDNMIVSCARDNQVRLNELDSTGEVASSRKLAQHRGPSHKLSVHPENPQVILSCGEDSVVYSIDIREEKPQRLISVREKNRKIALYSIHSNPLASYEFCVSGRDEYLRIYDARKLSTSTVSVSVSQNESPDSSPDENSPPTVKRFCPQHLIDSRAKAHVTAAVYNYNGKEVLGTYNDENIYLFDATHSDMADCIKVYEGHRNSATVKGVNFFGDRSQFVITGSDCGHIFIFDKETESIVNFFRGDENGVVNCLEPHPSAPILATSGLDEDVKIWIPSNEKPPKMGDLAATVRRNLKKRKEELDDQAIDGHMMWALLNHMRRTERQRRREAGELSGTSSDDDEEGEDADFHYRGNDCRIS